jgi:hypothetical protein
MQRRRAIGLRRVHVGLLLQKGAHGRNILFHGRIRNIADGVAAAAGPQQRHDGKTSGGQTSNTHIPSFRCLDGCALSGLHSQPLIFLMAAPFRACIRSRSFS